MKFLSRNTEWKKTKIRSAMNQHILILLNQRRDY